MTKPRILQRPLEDDSVIKEIIRNNIHDHGHMDELDKARCFAELRRLIRRCSDANGSGNGELRDRIATKLGFGLSGRTLERLARLLVLPQAIQDAVSKKVITKGLAERILDEPPDTQSQIAADLQAGRSRDAIVRDFRLTNTVANTPEKAFSRLLKSIVTEVPLIASVGSLPDNRLLTRRNLSRIDVAIEHLAHLRDQLVAMTSTDLTAKPTFRNLAVRSAMQRNAQDNLAGP